MATHFKRCLHTGSGLKKKYFKTSRAVPGDDSFPYFATQGSFLARVNDSVASASSLVRGKKTGAMFYTYSVHDSSFPSREENNGKIPYRADSGLCHAPQYS